MAETYDAAVEIRDAINRLTEQSKRVADRLEAMTDHRDGAMGLGDIYDEIAGIHEVLAGAMRPYSPEKLDPAGVPKRFVDVEATTYQE